MALPQVLEGTWDELAVYADELRGKKLRLTIVGEDTSKPQETEESRVAAVWAGMGKFADPLRSGLAGEELRRERQQDDVRLEQNLSYKP